MDDVTMLSAQIGRERANLATQGAVIAGLRNDPKNRRSLPIHEFIFYVVQQKYDLLVLVESLIRDEASRSVWLKYLALQMNEALKTLPGVGAAVVRHYRQLGNPNHAQLDALQAALAQFGSDVRHLRGGRLHTNLLAVRNSVTAHHRKKGGGPIGLVPLIEWTTEHASKAGRAVSPEHQEILTGAIDLGNALDSLGAGIQKAVFK